MEIRNVYNLGYASNKNYRHDGPGVGYAGEN